MAGTKFYRGPEPDWDLLRKAADSIEAGEIGFDIHEPVPCDTEVGFVGDIAGHIVAAADMDAFLDCVVNFGKAHARAADLLNLPAEQSRPLFDPPGDVDLNANRALLPSALRWFADTKSLSWPHAARYFVFVRGTVSRTQPPIGGFDWHRARKAALARGKS